MPRGPFGLPRATSIGPFVKGGIVTELENAIGDEGSAETEYQKLIDLLEQGGYEEKAERVREIQKDEIRHRKQFKAMLREVKKSNNA